MTPGRRHTAVAIVLIVLAVGGALGWRVTTSPDDEAAATPRVADDPDAVVTAAVERRALAADVVTRGEVVASSMTPVVAPAPAEDAVATVVTRPTGEAGDEIAAGSRLVDLNGRPLLAWPSRLPLYRDLRPGLRGPDVAAVQDALAAMGATIPSDERSVFGPSTEAAVATVYAAQGAEATYTAGSAAAVQEAKAAARAAVTARRAEADTARAAGTPDPDAEEAYRTALAERARVEATEGVTLLAREVVAGAALPATLVQVSVVEGQEVAEGDLLVTLGTTPLQVRAGLTAAQAREVGTSARVTVASDAGFRADCGFVEPHPSTPLPAGADEGGRGTEDQAASASPAAADTDADAAEDAFVALLPCLPAPPLTALGTGVQVTFTVARSEGEALVVPVTAVATAADGTTSVEVVEGNGVRRVPVAMGREATGFVAVAPTADGTLGEGDRVRVRRG